MRVDARRRDRGPHELVEESAALGEIADGLAVDDQIFDAVRVQLERGLAGDRVLPDERQSRDLLLLVRRELVAPELAPLGDQAETVRARASVPHPDVGVRRVASL